MRVLRCSCWLVGICVAGAAAGATNASQQSDKPFRSQALDWRTTELTGGLKLALASGEQSSRVELCVGFTLPALAREGKAVVGALVDLEMRREALASGQQRAAATAETWRRIEHVTGDKAVLCISAPKLEFDAALAAVLDTTKPIAATANDCTRALEQWHAHGGLAAVGAPDSPSARLTALAWLGSVSPPPSITLALQQVSSSACEHWHNGAPTSPAPVTLAVVGDFNLTALESEIRAHRLVRQRLHVTPGQGGRQVTAPRLLEQSFPRFVRLRTNEPESALVMGWPVIRQAERQEIGLQVIAFLIEQRLNRTLVARERRATARMSWTNGYGTLQIEVRPTRPDELASTEERVLAVLDQLRTNQVSTTEFESALSQATSPTPVTGDLDLDRALQMAQKALLSWNSRAMTKPADTHPRPTDLLQWISRDLSRARSSEVFLEPIAPRQRAAARSEGQRPKGLTYVVKPGESLQMIARKYRVTIPELIRANHLHHPDQIAPGTRLLIPSARPATPSN